MCGSKKRAGARYEEEEDEDEDEEQEQTEYDSPDQETSFTSPVRDPGMLIVIFCRVTVSPTKINIQVLMRVVLQFDFT